MSGDLPKIILRISMSLVFIYFGFSQAYSPSSWASFVPSPLTSFGMSANNLVMVNSIVELCLGTFLLIGLYTRLSALVLSLHLFAIAAPIGLNPLGIRDFGLAAATLAIFLNKTDSFCLDRKFIRKK